MKKVLLFEQYIEEGKGWAKLMKAVKAGSKSGPWSIVSIEGGKVVNQELVNVIDAIPAHYEEVKKRFPNAKMSIEDNEGMQVYNESVVNESDDNFNEIRELATGFGSIDPNILKDSKKEKFASNEDLIEYLSQYMDRYDSKNFLKLAYKKFTNEAFVNEKREDVGKYNTVKKVIAKLGRRPSEQELAQFITDNYYDVTEVERGDDDPRADDKIADLVAFYKFDIDDWEIAWEDAQNESVVNESDAYTISRMANDVGLGRAEDFLDKYNVDLELLANAVRRGSISKYELRDIVNGDVNSSKMKQFVKTYVNEATITEVVDLVHVYDKDGKIFGTGELVKTKGSKSLIRWDGSKEEWVDSDLVKVVESKQSDALAKEIDKAMIKIDDSMSYSDFALAVGKILREEYGSHNYKGFMEVLHKDLGI